VSPTPDSTFADPQQIMADLRRELEIVLHVAVDARASW
jgi:hypothetical protein